MNSLTCYLNQKAVGDIRFRPSRPSCREDVLNHRILEQGALPQQQPVMYGMLIGRGTAPIPADHPHGSYADVILRVYDQKGRRHEAVFTVKIDRRFQDRIVPPEGEQLLSP